MEPLTYSNPRMKATIPDWPSGSKRVAAEFEIESINGKERGIRTTTGAPKKLTFARLARIVDGSDGRTYILELSFYGHITVKRGDFKYDHETVFEKDPRYPELLELFARDI
jgi:hypothetical protein